MLQLNQYLEVGLSLVSDNFSILRNDQELTSWDWYLIGEISIIISVALFQDPTQDLIQDLIWDAI